MINYILYDRKTGEIVSAAQSRHISNPHGYEVMETEKLMIGIDATHRVNKKTMQLEKLPKAESRKRKGRGQH